MNKIAIIDDDVYIGNMLEELLTKEGYSVIRAYSGTEALMLLTMQKPDLILLDLMLPGLSGEEVLPHISHIPVIIVSAKVDIGDKVKLLLDGAADYITKPFDTKELLARITVQLRKANPAGNKELLSFGDLVMDETTHSVMLNKTPLKLTKTEYAILKQLLLNPSQVVPKSRLLDLISKDTLDCTESSLKVHVGNLRKKLRNICDKDYIDSVWGIGFKMHEL
ncbi:response regulator transcription factor [Lachnospiraceae bacterium OttesenSCG-928-D06]|nr:response regulator transcription factor [Lachnospiraceae bacterium OttesenSCG-928-D06]